MIAVPASVRQGLRLTPKALPTLLAQFHTFPLLSDYDDSGSDCGAARFHAVVSEIHFCVSRGGDISNSNSKTNHNLVLGLELCGVLSDSNWGGWKSLALPRMIKALPTYLEKSESVNVGKVLVVLVREQRIEGVESAWKERPGRFEEWGGAEEQVCFFVYCLLLELSLGPGILIDVYFSFFIGS